MSNGNPPPVVPLPIPPQAQTINVTPNAGGLSGLWGIVGNISAVTFVLVVTWTVLQWQHESVTYAQQALEAERAANSANLQKLWDSLNTSNHNAAGLTNGIAELQKSITLLQSDVKMLNRTTMLKPPAAADPQGTP